MFEIDRLEAVDIDEELDFRVAEFLYEATRFGSTGPLHETLLQGMQPVMPESNGHDGRQRALEQIRTGGQGTTEAATAVWDTSPLNVQAPGRNREA
jgi:hypothetical protein